MQRFYMTSSISVGVLHAAIQVPIEEIKELE